MKKLWINVLLAALLCTGCMATAGPQGAGIAIVPRLPVVVELEDPYYYQGDYHYYYNNDQWYYSRTRGGPWVDLPRDRYPKEVRHKGKNNNQGQGWKRGNDKN